MASSSTSKAQHPLFYRASRKLKIVDQADTDGVSLPERKHTRVTSELSDGKQPELPSESRFSGTANLFETRPMYGRRLSNIDCAEFFSGDIFEFIIGEEEVSFKVHDAALKGLSEPLWFMMTNSSMQESLTRTIRIHDHDPYTFARFLKFAYLGFCGISDGITDQNVEPIDLPLYFRCHYCSNGYSLAKNSNYPFHNTDCRVNYNSYISNNMWPCNAYCVVYGCSNIWSLDGSRTLLCATHRYTEVGRSYPAFREATDPPPDGRSLSKCSEEFVKRQYGCGKLSHEDLCHLLKQHNPSGKSTSSSRDTGSDIPLLEHAKIYVFAHQYMIEDLQDISLHKLHRNLVAVGISNDTINELSEVVAFSYSRTSDEGDILKGSADRLRTLVMAFVLDRKKELMSFSGFRDMLGQGGPQTADFFGLAFSS